MGRLDYGASTPWKVVVRSRSFPEWTNRSVFDELLLSASAERAYAASDSTAQFQQTIHWMVRLFKNRAVTVFSVTELFLVRWHFISSRRVGMSSQRMTSVDLSPGPKTALNICDRH